MIPLGTIQTHVANSDRPALIERGKATSWAELECTVLDAMAGLTDALPPADPDAARRPRIAFLCRNSVDLVALQAASATLKCTLVGLDYSLPAVTLAQVVQDIGPDLLVHDEAFEAECADIVRHTSAEMVTISLQTLVTGAPGAVPSGPYPGPFEAIGLTSGTSGTPKVVMRTSSMDEQRHHDLVDLLGFDQNDTYLNVVPLYHASGPGWAKIFMRIGATVIISDGSDADRVAHELRTHSPTASLMVPPVLEAVTAACLASGTRSHSMRCLITGGRHVNGCLVSKVAAVFGDSLRIYYGTTETGVNSLTGRGELLYDPLTAGQPLPGITFAIIGADNQLSPANKVGRVGVKGYMVADGYSAATDRWEQVGQDTYWITSDYGRVDERGNLYITSRDADAELAEVDLVQLESQLLTRFPHSRIALHWDPAVTDRLIAHVEGRLGSDARERLNSYIQALLPKAVEIHINSLEQLQFSLTGKIRTLSA